MQLQPSTVQALFQDVEDLGISRDQVNIIKLIDENRKFYGASGSEERELLSKKFSYHKKTPIENYAKFLKRIGVKPSAFMELLLKIDRADKAASSDEKDEVVVSEEEESEEEHSEEESEEEKNKEDHKEEDTDNFLDSLTSNFNSLNIRTVAEMSSNESNANYTPHKGNLTPQRFTSPPPSSYGSPTPSYAGSVALHSPAPSHSFASPVASAQGQDSHSDGSSLQFGLPLLNREASAGVPLNGFLPPDGTRGNPYVIVVNPRYPERNWGFDVTFIEKMKDGKYLRKAIVIRKVVTGEDYTKWEAYKPNEDQVPEAFKTMIRHLVLIRGPSQDFFLKNTKRFHKSLMKNKWNVCTNLEAEHQVTETAITSNKVDRGWAYYLLVMPNHHNLDNTILSEDESKLKLERVPIKLDANESRFKKEVNAIVLLWRIADRKGNIKVTIDDESEDVDDACLFD